MSSSSDDQTISRARPGQTRQNEVPQPATKPNNICQVGDAPVPAGQNCMVLKAIEGCTLTICMLPHGEGPMLAALQP